ncbi:MULTISPECIES: tyrosine-type recombinase/integrase [unclassified Sulfitobacter]|uniref:tyrosine-type recombinase/integrase n=1 Tax=unclassified Sulfitobacter TaxID=196795 RepID=UPI0023E0BFA3|nr:MULTISPECIES: tyrosine-type recombinase/integrase [unclassified Sulfitobacter]MDF3384600.1 site-specific integrase [Sulfitobacter sp. Ks11]MDF3388088.1 site-specific integrase [Sulfitobacter sp. M85]MDF3391509.1 site-specific integrase [Sulfitobacter sp. Ks16]MDF3402075.1 site-specific integrase [Sulfitobacter sp. KE39]MDF3405567.1 site-specific integrase [Sulfitobacter sp. Ks35]
MTDQTKIFEGLFVPPATPSFADLIQKLTTIDMVTPKRRKDLISGLRRVAEALELTPSQVLADPRWLQPRLVRIAPAALGITNKTWQNSISNARSAMAACGIVTKRQRRTSDLSPEWRNLWTAVQASKDRSLLSSLPRFVFFLDRIGVAPKDVRSDHALFYLKAVTSEEISKAPHAAYKLAVSGWNLAVDRLPVWPRQRLEMPSQTRRVMLPETDYSPSFLVDVDHYLETRRRPDLLAAGEYLRPITESSAKTYRYMVLRFASHVVQTGIPANEIGSIEDLLCPKHTEAGLRHMLAANGGEKSVSISDTARLLLTIAAHRGLPETVRTRLAYFKARLMVRDIGGMTAKNRERLRALRAPGILTRLIHLPEQIMARPLGPHRVKAMRAREDAIAIAILPYCPLRISNLSTLEIDRHLCRPDKGKMFVVIPAGEVKNNRPLEFELPAHLVRMIDTHFAERAPHLCAQDCPYLFPAARSNGPVKANILSERIKKRLRAEIGVEMNVHLFRHLAVMIYLDANPGGYEVARQMLGHSSVSRTINVYSGLETIKATQAFSAVVDSLRKDK